MDVSKLQHLLEVCPSCFELLEPAVTPVFEAGHGSIDWISKDVWLRFKTQFYLHSFQIVTLCKADLEVLLPLVEAKIPQNDTMPEWVSMSERGLLLQYLLETQIPWFTSELVLLYREFLSTKGLFCQPTVAPIQLLEQWIAELQYRCYKVLHGAKCIQVSHSSSKVQTLFQLCYPDGVHCNEELLEKVRCIRREND